MTRKRSKIVMPTDAILTKPNNLKLASQIGRTIEINNQTYNNIVKKNPKAKLFSRKSVLESERSGKQFEENGKLYTPTTYRQNKTYINPDTKTKKLHLQDRLKAKEILDKRKELNDVLQTVEIVNNPDNPIGWIPGIRSLINTGADLRYRTLTGENSSPYVTDAALSTVGDAALLGFGLGPLKNYAGAYAGSVAGGIIGDDYPNLGRFVGGLAGGFSPYFTRQAFKGTEWLLNQGMSLVNKYPNLVAKLRHPTYKKYYHGTSADYDLSTVSKYTPELWDEAYSKALQSRDMLQVQLLRDLHYLASVPHSELTISSGKPITYYHGTPAGGHAVFNSSVSNATIGGESAVGVKGNFLTSSKDAATKYAHGSTTVNPKFMHTYTDKYVTLLMDIKNPSKQLLLEQYKEYEKTLIKNGIIGKKKNKLLNAFLELNDISQNEIFNTSVLQDRVIYPFYVNPGNNIKRVNFENNAWSEYPQKISSTYLVKERTPMWYPTKTLNRDINRTSLAEDLRTLSIFDNKEDALSFMNNRLGRRTKLTKMSDDRLNTTNDAYTYPENRLRYRSTIGVFENKYPQTTNGIVQNAYDTGHTSVIIDNVKDGVDYPIQDFVTLNGNLMKLANPITYDNNGNIIPLSKRDNWLMPDVRYSILPLLPLPLGISMYANSEQ